VGPDANKTLFGVDALSGIVRCGRAIYHRFQARTSSLEPAGWPVDDGSAAEVFGWYGLAEYQFARLWFSGVPLDRSSRTLNADFTDSGLSAFITYWPSAIQPDSWTVPAHVVRRGTEGQRISFPVSTSQSVRTGAHAF